MYVWEKAGETQSEKDLKRWHIPRSFQFDDPVVYLHDFAAAWCESRAVHIYADRGISDEFGRTKGLWVLRPNYRGRIPSLLACCGTGRFNSRYTRTWGWNSCPAVLPQTGKNVSKWKPPIDAVKGSPGLHKFIIVRYGHWAMDRSVSDLGRKL